MPGTKNEATVYLFRIGHFHIGHPVQYTYQFFCNVTIKAWACHRTLEVLHSKRNFSTNFLIKSGDKCLAKLWINLKASFLVSSLADCSVLFFGFLMFFIGLRALFRLLVAPPPPGIIFALVLQMALCNKCKMIGETPSSNLKLIWNRNGKMLGFFIQYFCQFIILELATSTQDFKCSISWSKVS